MTTIHVTFTDEKNFCLESMGLDRALTVYVEPDGTLDCFVSEKGKNQRDVTLYEGLKWIHDSEIKDKTV